MTDVRVLLPDQPGWSVVSAAGLHVVVRAGGALVSRVREAADAGDLDGVLDALTSEGLRSTPDFVAVAATEPVRVVTRGEAYAVASTDAGEAELRAPQRGPWGDEDAPAGTTSVRVVVPGAAEPEEPTPQEEPVAAPEPAAPEPAAPAVVSAAPEATQLPPSEDEAGAQRQAPEEEPVGWRRPQLLNRRGDQDDAVPGSAPEQPAPAPAPAAKEEDEEVEELPSYDHLFGATQHDRPAYIEQHDTGTIEEPPIGHAPIESAGGFAGGPPDPQQAEHTLAPPTHTQAPPPVERPPAQPPAAAPPAPPAEPPRRGGIIDSVPWRSGGSNVPSPDPAPADRPSPRPAPGGSRTPPPAPSLRPPVTPPPPSNPAPSPSVPPPPASPSVPPAPQPPSQQEAPPTPAAQPPAPPAPAVPAAPAADDREATVDRASLLAGSPAAPSGPLVLAVLCPAGHVSPPHSGTCRQCGREIPPQQPFQTSRPPLGVLRLPNGDVVTLDRGVLLGRSPKVNAELDAAQRPHLVRVASPENDISRNHVEIVLEGWHALIRDLGSTNGTTLTLPGQLPVRLRPADQQVLEPGTVITLADEVAITYEVPS